MAEFLYQGRKQSVDEQAAAAQRKGKAILDDNRAPQQPAQRKSAVSPNGLPERLKSGVESLSGMSMDHVKVHYNSPKPAQLNAHAYAQGNEIHMGPGQERHLAHEAWHVVQQARGRVKPTTQMAGVHINGDASLESEADHMGARAAAMPLQRREATAAPVTGGRPGDGVVQAFNWRGSTPLATLGSFWRSPSWQGAKDIVDPRRWRMNPLNLVEGIQNYREETAPNSNYHSSSKHGAHNTLENAMGRLQPRPSIGRVLSGMDNQYTGHSVDHQNAQGRFNSEAWEAYAWRKAKQLFVANLPAGTPVQWQSNALANPRSTWTAILHFPNEDVGLSGNAAGIQSVEGVKVAINYRQMLGPPMAGALAPIAAANGQMFPANHGAAVVPGVQHPTDPVVGQNGLVIPVPAPPGLLGKIGYKLGLV
jgi:hypothetical protein